MFREARTLPERKRARGGRTAFENLKLPRARGFPFMGGSVIRVSRGRLKGQVCARLEDELR
jgi:hypothetical protein